MNAMVLHMIPRPHVMFTVIAKGRLDIMMLMVVEVRLLVVVVVKVVVVVVVVEVTCNL